MCLVVLAALLARDPFSDRTLIPNFEPFPDALYYVVPPRCWLHGQGWSMCVRSGASFSTVVPPLYSIALLPFFLLNDDPRMFYFANVLLSVAAVVLLFLILKKITKHLLIQFAVLFLFVTNYFTYWYPTLAMAENLLIPLFLAGLYVCLQKTSIKKIVLLLLIAVGLYQTKHAYAPLTAVFLLASLESFFTQPFIATRIRTSRSHLGGLALIALFLIAFVFAITQHEIRWILSDDFFKLTIPDGGQTWFSLAYWSDHSKIYISALFGQPQKFLWDSTPLMPMYTGIFGTIGLLVGLRSSVTRRLSIVLLLSVIGQLTFISTFYAADIRYIYHVLPAMLIGVTIALQHLVQSYPKPSQVRAISIGILVVLFVYVAQHSMQWKRQIAINLKYAETPWWNIAVEEVDRYFASTISEGSRATNPIIITAIPPFLFDFYAKTPLQLLPLNLDQDFRQAREVAWGKNDYTNLISLYEQKLAAGEELYVTNYGLAGGKYLVESFAEIEQSFALTQVFSGCYNLCNIYKLELQ